jgi:hypothetical protein
MHLDASAIVILSVCELAALIAIVRLWTRKHRMHVVVRLLWSIVLLMPFFGLLFYGFTRSDPGGHSDDVPDSTYGSDPGAH